jgi:hypothetical protein
MDGNSIITQVAQDPATKNNNNNNYDSDVEISSPYRNALTPQNSNYITFIVSINIILDIHYFAISREENQTEKLIANFIMLFCISSRRK